MNTSLAITLAAGIATTAAFAEKPVDCSPIAARTQTTAERATVDPIELLKLVDKEVAAYPDCACEVVRAAIIGTNCDDAIVGYVVETAVRAAPEHMRLIAQCAIATAPDSLTRVQEVLSRLDPAAGKEGKSAKSAKGKGIEVKPAATPPNPLDIPRIEIPPIPPVIVPPPSTPTDFRRPPVEEEIPG
ncbi:hypothetical protein [Haloferula helveola]